MKLRERVRKLIVADLTKREKTRQQMPMKTYLLDDIRRQIESGRAEGVPLASRIDALDQVSNAFNELRRDGIIAYTPYKQLVFNRELAAEFEVVDKPYIQEIGMADVVVVEFPTSPDKHYSYLNHIEGVQVGDLVVTAPNHHEYKVAKVVQTEGLMESQAKKATKWLVCKIDVSAYEELIERERLKQEIRNKLRKRREQMEELLIFQQLAQTDPEIKELLGRYAELDDSIALPAGGTVQLEDKKEEGK